MNPYQVLAVIRLTSYIGRSVKGGIENAAVRWQQTPGYRRRQNEREAKEREQAAKERARLLAVREQAIKAAIQARMQMTPEEREKEFKEWFDSHYQVPRQKANVLPWLIGLAVFVVLSVFLLTISTRNTEAQQSKPNTQPSAAQTPSTLMAPQRTPEQEDLPEQTKSSLVLDEPTPQNLRPTTTVDSVAALLRTVRVTDRPISHEMERIPGKWATMAVFFDPGTNVASWVTIPDDLLNAVHVPSWVVDSKATVQLSGTVLTDENGDLQFDARKPFSIRIPRSAGGRDLRSGSANLAH